MIDLASRLGFADDKGTPVAVEWVDLAKARTLTEGNGYQIDLTIPPAPADGACASIIGIMAVFADGTPMVYQRPRENCAWTGPGPLLADYRVGTWSPGAADPTLWPSTRSLVASGAPRQVGAAATSGNWAVWEETESTDLITDNWRVFAHNRITGKTTLLGRSEDLTGKGHDLAAFYPSFTIGGDRAYWSTAPADDVNGQSASPPEVVSAPLDGSAPLRVETTNADDPVVTSQAVVVRRAVSTAHLVQSAVDAWDVETSPWPTELVGLGGGQEHAVLTLTSPQPLPARIEALAAAGSIVTFAVANCAFIYNLDTRRLTGFEGPGPGVYVPPASQGTDANTEASVVNAVAVESRWVAWTFGGGSASDTAPLYLYQPGTGALSRVDVARSFGELWLADNTVGWRSAINQGTVLASLALATS